MQSDFSTKSPLGRAKGLGASHEGTQHWWMQRITSIALIPLVFWLVFSVAAVVGHEREVVIANFGHPITALALVATISVGLYHALLGVQVVIEDYIHSDGLRLITLWAMRFLMAALAGLSFVSIIIMVYSHLTRMN